MKPRIAITPSFANGEAEDLKYYYPKLKEKGVSHSDIYIKGLLILAKEHKIKGDTSPSIEGRKDA